MRADQDLAAEAIYNRMDRSRMGRVMINDLACYLRGACNFNVSDYQLYQLMGLFDKEGSRHGNISRDAFVNSVGSPAMEEE
jgi:Ca2+-binding EF-hand superfamily protein